VQDVYAAKGSKTFWHYKLQNRKTQIIIEMMKILSIYGTISAAFYV